MGPTDSESKVATAKLIGNREIEIWGDGEQTRSFCHVDDCVQGIYKLMRSDFSEPLNLGQDRMVSINELAHMVARIAGKTNAATLTGCELFFWGRLAHWLIYLIGIPWLRTLAWVVSVIGLVTIFLQLVW